MRLFRGKSSSGVAAKVRTNLQCAVVRLAPDSCVESFRDRYHGQLWYGRTGPENVLSSRCEIIDVTGTFQRNKKLTDMT